MTGAPATPWIPSRTKGRRARTPLVRVWCSVRQYAYHAMHSLRIAPGSGHPFRFFLSLGLCVSYLEESDCYDEMNAKAALMNRFYKRLCDFATFVERFASGISLRRSQIAKQPGPVTWRVCIFALGQSFRG